MKRQRQERSPSTAHGPLEGEGEGEGETDEKMLLLSQRNQQEVQLESYGSGRQSARMQQRQQNHLASVATAARTIRGAKANRQNDVHMTGSHHVGIGSNEQPSTPNRSLTANQEPPPPFLSSTQQKQEQQQRRPLVTPPTAATSPPFSSSSSSSSTPGTQLLPVSLATPEPMKKINRLPVGGGGDGHGPPVIQVSSACLLIPVFIAMWWYYAKKTCQRVFKGLLLRHTPEPPVTRTTRTTTTMMSTSPPAFAHQESSLSALSMGTDTMSGQYRYTRWEEMAGDDADAPGNRNQSERLVKWIHTGDLQRRKHKQELRNVTRRIVYGTSSPQTATTKTTTPANNNGNCTTSNCNTSGGAMGLKHSNSHTPTAQIQTTVLKTIEMTSYDSGNYHSSNRSANNLQQPTSLDPSLPHPVYQPPLSSSLETMPISVTTMEEDSNTDPTSDNWECLQDVAGSMDLCSLRYSSSLVAAAKDEDINDDDDDDGIILDATPRSKLTSAGSAGSTLLMSPTTVTPTKSLLDNDAPHTAPSEEEVTDGVMA